MEKEGKAIIIKYGELWLKSENVKRVFINRLSFFLRDVVKRKGKDIRFFWKRDHGVVVFEEHEREFLIALLSLTPGIAQYHEADIFKLKDLDNIWERVDKELGEEIRDAQTFAVRCKRAGKHEFSSKDVEKYIGAKIVEKYGKKVDLDNAELTVRIEIRQDYVYLIKKTYSGVRGLPPYSSGEIAAYLEESKVKEGVVMLYELFKRGVKILPFSSSPLSPEINKLIDFLSYSPLHEAKLKGLMERHTVIALSTTTETKIKEMHEKSQKTNLKPLLLFPLLTFSKKDVERKYEEIVEKFRKIETH